MVFSDEEKNEEEEGDDVTTAKRGMLDLLIGAAKTAKLSPEMYFKGACTRFVDHY